MVYWRVTSSSDLSLLSLPKCPLCLRSGCWGKKAIKRDFSCFSLSNFFFFFQVWYICFLTILKPCAHTHTQPHTITNYTGLERPVSGVWTHHYQLQPEDLLNLTALLIDCNCMVTIDWLHPTQCDMHWLEVTGKGKGNNDFPSCPLANDPVQTLMDILPYWRRNRYFCISLWIFCLPGKRRFWFPF